MALLTSDYNKNTDNIGTIPDNTKKEKTDSSATPVVYKKGEGITDFGFNNQMGSNWSTILKGYAKQINKGQIDVEDLIKQYNGEDGYLPILDEYKPSIKEWLTTGLGKKYNVDASRLIDNKKDAETPEEPEKPTTPSIQETPKPKEASVPVANKKETASVASITPNEDAGTAKLDETVQKGEELKQQQQQIAQEQIVNARKQAANDLRAEIFSSDSHWTPIQKQRAANILNVYEETGTLSNEQLDTLQSMSEAAKATYSGLINEGKWTEEDGKLADNYFGDTKAALQQKLDEAETPEQKAQIQTEMDNIDREERALLEDTNRIYEEYINGTAQRQSKALNSFIDQVAENVPPTLSYFLAQKENWTDESGDPDKQKIFRNLYWITSALRYNLQKVGNSAFKVAGISSEEPEKDEYNKIRDSEILADMQRNAEGKQKAQDANMQLLIDQYGISQDTINKVREINNNLKDKIADMSLSVEQEALVYRGYEKLGNYISELSEKDRARILQAMIYSSKGLNEMAAGVLKFVSPNVLDMLGAEMPGILNKMVDDTTDVPKETSEEARKRIEETYGSSMNLKGGPAIIEGFKEMKRWFSGTNK